MKLLKEFIPVPLFLVCMIGVTAYGARYQLGLVKPKFKAGDCIMTTYENEFEITHSYRLIVGVGKTEYQSLRYDATDARALPEKNVDKMRDIDENYIKISCPAKITIMR